MKSKIRVLLGKTTRPAVATSKRKADTTIDDEEWEEEENPDATNILEFIGCGTEHPTKKPQKKKPTVSTKAITNTSEPAKITQPPIDKTKKQNAQVIVQNPRPPTAKQNPLPPAPKQDPLPPAPKQISLPPAPKQDPLPPAPKQISLPPAPKQSSLPLAPKQISLPPAAQQISLPPPLPQTTNQDDVFRSQMVLNRELEAEVALLRAQLSKHRKDLDIGPAMKHYVEKSYSNFGEAIGAFRDFLTQMHIVDAAVQTPASDATMMEDIDTKMVEMANPSFGFHDVMTVHPASHLSSYSNSTAVFQYTYDDACNVLLGTNESLDPNVIRVIQAQLQAVFDDLFPSLALVLAFYTWCVRFRRKHGHEKSSTARLTMLTDRADDDMAMTYLRSECHAHKKTEMLRNNFVWTCNPYVKNTIWKHKSDERFVLSELNISLPPYISPRNGWTTEPNMPPIVLVGHDVDKMATWFIKKGFNIYNYALEFDCAAQVLLQPFSSDAHASDIDRSFGPHVTHRLGRLIRHKIARRNQSAPTDSGLLVHFWNKCKAQQAKKPVCLRSVIVGADCLLDATDIGLLQSREDARVVAWNKAIEDCAVTINTVIHQLSQLHSII